MQPRVILDRPTLRIQYHGLTLHIHYDCPTVLPEARVIRINPRNSHAETAQHQMPIL
jgi:hypothetical protein